MTQPSPFRRPWVLLGITAARLYFFGFLYLFFLHTDLRPERKDFVYQADGQSREQREAEIRQSFWERLAPFDGQFYLDIANRGYRTISSSIQGDLGNFAFFPLLPALLSALRAGFPHAYLPLAIGLTLALAVAGTLAVWRIAERCGASALLAVGVLLSFPSAPFQYVLYTEGIFLCLSGLTLLHAMDRRPWPALLFGLLGGLCRPQGVLLAIPIFLELVVPSFKGAQRGSRPPLAAWLAACAPFAGFALLAVICNHVTGSPFSFLTVQGKWGRSYEAGGVLKAITSIFGYGGPPMDLLGLLVGLGCIPVLWKRLPPSLSLYGMAAVLMPLATGSILSFGRFMSVSIPHILALSMVLRDRGMTARLGVLALFLVLQYLLARGLIGWYFVG
jgi:hypothetical protein